MPDTYNADSITVLEGLDAVRKTPGMYIGSTGQKGVNHMLYEIVDNSVDEHMAGYCSEIIVKLNADGSATVQDNGRGIPVEMHKKGVSAERVVLTTLHAGGKFDRGSYRVSGGLHGVGSSVVNALSEFMKIDISRGGSIYHDEYKRGKPAQELKDGLLPVVGKSKTTGTKTTFKPDSEIFDTVLFGTDEIKSRLHQIAYLNPGLSITFIDERKNSKKDKVIYLENDGIAGMVSDMCRDDEKIQKNPVVLSGISENIKVDCAFQYIEEFHENITGFCNSIYTVEGGTHITGFKAAFTTVINGYARQLGVLKDKDDNFTGADVRSGMVAVVSIKHPAPVFEGQTKTKLNNQDAAKAVSSVITEQLTRYFDRNPSELKAIIDCAQKASNLRHAAERTKMGMLQKPKYSFDSNGKLANCNSKDASKCEIFIVEGDSAAGSAKMGRDRKYQAIFPIRGKILNVQKASIDKVLSNAEIKTMIYAFGCGFSEGYGNDFNIEKLRYDKIIIMADADVDGSHIATLLLSFFYNFMPELIYEGHVYVAMPPLYKASTPDGKEQYLYDDKALTAFRKSHRSFKLQRYKGLGEMSAEQLWETTLCPKTRKMRQIEIDDAKRAADITSLLMGDGVQARREYIQKNAQSANLSL